MDPKLKQALVDSLTRVLELIQSADADQEMEEEEYFPEDEEPPAAEGEENWEEEESEDWDVGDEDEEEGDVEDTAATDEEEWEEEEEGEEEEEDEEEEDLEPAPDEEMPDEMGYDEDGLPPTATADDEEESLHERVSRLEAHTGLRKTAGQSMSERIDALERYWLGEEYDGDPYKRVAQLEKAAWQGEQQAPDLIPLDDLIKAAVREGVREGIAQMQQELPDLYAYRRGSRRRAQRSVVQTEEDLKKAAQRWGNVEDLDAPVTLGDCLLYQWHVAQGGRALSPDVLDDDD